MLKIGEKIKKVRELKGLTPKDLAEKLSMTHQG
jgi:transcriptional regulator with XRE-family HTH domain